MCLAGYEPMVDCCAICGNPNPSQPCFHLREGVLHCKTCPVGAGETLSLCPDSLAALRHIVRAPSKRLYAFRLGADALAAGTGGRGVSAEPDGQAVPHVGVLQTSQKETSVTVS